MPRDKVPDDGGELTDLESKTSVLPRRNSKRIFVEPNLSAVIARIEPTIQSRLRKQINMRTKLRVEKQRQTGIEEIVDLAVDKARRWLLEMITFDINRAA